VIAGVALAGLAWVANASAITPVTATKPKLGVTIAECVSGADPTQRVATFHGSMPAIAKATRMQMRFTLYQRIKRQPFSAVVVPDWRGWVRSAPSQPGFVVDRRIDSLLPGAQYRVMVEFRWLNAKGRTVRATNRLSKVCTQAKQATPLQ
jgi:hypothetical protein